MLNRDKNEFYSIIKEYNFKQNQFTVSEDEISGMPAFIIEYKDSPLRFIIRNAISSFKLYDCVYITFAPDFPKSNYFPERGMFSDLSHVLDIFRKWILTDLNEYIVETSVPNHWDDVLQEENEDFWNNESYDQFSSEEKVTVVKMIASFKEQIIQTYSPNATQLVAISNKMDYLIESVERLNKFDWKSILLSTLFSVVIAMNLDTTKGQELFALARNIFTEAMILLK